MGSGASIQPADSLQKRRFQRIGFIVLYGTTSKIKNSGDLLSLPQFSMDARKKECITNHFRRTLMKERPEIFVSTILTCMRSSSRFNSIMCTKEIIMRDSTSWPRLQQIGDEQLAFYDKLIFVLKLDPAAVMEAVHSLAIIHFRYSKHEMIKPHLLEMWQQNLEMLMRDVIFPKESERNLFLIAMSELTSFIVSTLQVVSLRCHIEHKKEEQEDLQLAAAAAAAVCPHLQK